MEEPTLARAILTAINAFEQLREVGPDGQPRRITPRRAAWLLSAGASQNSLAQGWLQIDLHEQLERVARQHEEDVLSRDDH